MPMPPYPIYCSTKGCKNLATYKIAARWSDGAHEDLKTYGLCCPECLPQWFRQSQEKQKKCQLIPGEILESPGIYHLQRGSRDAQLQRLADIERQLQSKPNR